MKNTLLKALDKAGEALRASFHKTLTITVKENQSSIVTNADLESEKIIIGTIIKTFPGHNIISEEYGHVDNHSDITWVIDPLDGTSNFASGIPWFGVLIAVLKDSKPILAGACLPEQHDFYYAEKGIGSFKNNIRIHTASSTNLKEMLVAFSTDYNEDEAYINKGLGLLKKLITESRNVRSTNSLIDMLYVAEGKFGACINMYTKIWDIAAPCLIIQEAGGFMTDLWGNEIHFCLKKEDYSINYPIITASGTMKSTIDVIIEPS
jgi:myo-inositol-1(or 4)-monophosphatase